MSRLTFALVASALAAMAVQPTDALAQERDVAAAEALFAEARSLMKAGEWKRACPKLEESQRLDPGVGTLANLARCYEKTNRLASAWAKYREAAGQAKRSGQKKRARQARKKADQLEPKLHRVAIIVPKRSQLPELTITRNGVSVGAGSYGTKVPVDQGDVEVTASAPGHQTWTKTISLSKGRKLRVIEIPRLKKAPIEKPLAGDDDDDDDDDPPMIGSPWYGDTIGWVLLGSGVVVAGAGGIGALSQASSLEKKSREPGIGVEEFDRLADQSNQWKTAGYALLIVGGGVAIAGAVKLALNPATQERRQAKTGLRGATVVAGPRSIGLFVRF